MSMKYYHDAANKIVKAMNTDLTVIEKKDRRGRRISWLVTSIIAVTRAVNLLLNGSQGWKYPVREHPRQCFDAHYSREDVLAYFFINHSPNLPEIEADEYERLREDYYSQAVKNTN